MKTNEESKSVELKRYENFTLRIFYLFTAGFLFYESFQNWLRGKIETHPEVVVLCVIGYSLALFLMTVSLSSIKILQRFKIIPLIALIFIMTSSIYVIAEIQYNGVYRTDSMAFTHYASQLWLFPSWNPYGHDLQIALEMFTVDVDYVTLKPDGDLVTNLNYPALHLLFFTPFAYFGLQDMRWITFIFAIAIILILYWKSPSEIRPLVLIPFFAGVDLAINFTAGCLNDFLWVLPLIITAFYIGNPLIAGLSFGLASAVKQQPWLLFPFLLTYIWRSEEYAGKKKTKSIVMFTTSTIVGFLLPNIIFILKDPKSWLSDVTTPFSGQLIVISQGLSTITQSGYVPLSNNFYFFFAVSVFFLLLIYYNLYFEDLKYAIWAFPALILWFSPRGLQNYFIYLIPICLVAIVTWYKTSFRRDLK